MKNRKKYGKKIKRTRTNLYRRKKTKAQKIAGTVLLVVVVLAVGFLGFCLGKPLLEYIDRNLQHEEPQWEPPPVTTTTPPATEETTISFSRTAAKEPTFDSERLCALSVPDTALQNIASLSAFAAKAKGSGYNAAVMELKDAEGYFHYASAAAAERDIGLIKAHLAPREIASVLKEAGLVPIGAISVLLDSAGCYADHDMSFKLAGEPDAMWLDYSTPEHCPRPDPSRPSTVKYLDDIVKELEADGITVLMRELCFPGLQEYDKRYLDAKYFADDRSAMLLPYTREGAPVEMLAEDVLADGYGRTAELLREKSFTGNAGNIAAVKILRSSFTSEKGYPADAAELVGAVAGEVKKKTGKLTLMLVIEAEEYSGAELEAVKTELSGYSLITE